MRLYFLRHGIAEDHRAGLPDGQRRLTDDGIEEMKEAARGMRELDLKLDAILMSPLVRARETAEIAGEALGTKPREEQRLACGCSFSELSAILRPFAGDARVMLVGHEPDMSTLVGTLIGGGQVRMKKAALACVETSHVAPGAGELRWLLNPVHLRRL